jgi:shikimate kinase
VVLLGLMGSGKTTVGRHLAQRTGWLYLDNDDLLQEVTGKTLIDVAGLGADTLHGFERDVARALVDREPPFVASAAAAVVDDFSVGELLHARTFTVYLHVLPSTIVARIGDDTHRPWLRPDPLTALENMYSDRDSLYRRVAAYVADATPHPKQVADRIYAELPRPM